LGIAPPTYPNRVSRIKGGVFVFGWLSLWPPDTGTDAAPGRDTHSGGWAWSSFRFGFVVAARFVIGFVCGRNRNPLAVGKSKMIIDES
jgi:hypothetical protein